MKIQGLTKVAVVLKKCMEWMRNTSVTQQSPTKRAVVLKEKTSGSYQEGGCPEAGANQKGFFFLQSRSSTRHSRSTTGILSRNLIRGRNFPGSKKPTKPNKTQTNSTKTQTDKQKATATLPGKFAKLSETR